MPENKNAHIGEKFNASRTNANKTVTKLKIAIAAKKNNSSNLALGALSS